MGREGGGRVGSWGDTEREREEKENRTRVEPRRSRENARRKRQGFHRSQKPPERKGSPRGCERFIVRVG